MRIVDDDVSWSSIAAAQENEEEEDEGDMPVVSGASTAAGGEAEGTGPAGRCAGWRPGGKEIGAGRGVWKVL